MSAEVPPELNTQGLAKRWAECSDGRDGSRHASTHEAESLAYAVEISLARGRPTADLTKTARDWGARLPSPSAVVSAVDALREAASSSEDPNVNRNSGGLVSANVLQILDDVLSGAIEGVSTSLREAALIDPLTGCANRRALKEDLERTVAGGRRTGLDVAVAVIDLDGLKQINDTYGHAVGDSTLQELARSLQGAIRDTDAVYRVGGDEFVVVIPFSGTSGAAAAMQRARALGAPMFSWGASSLSMLGPDSDVETLIEMADNSLYASRRSMRPITAPASRRHRAVFVGAAAATLVGIGLSSSYVLPTYLDRAAIGTPVRGNEHLGGGPSEGAQSSSGSRSAKPASVPPSGESTPPASDRTVRTEGPEYRPTSSGQGALTVSKTISPTGSSSPTRAVLTVATVLPSRPSKPVKKPKKPPTVVITPVIPVTPTTPVTTSPPQPTPPITTPTVPPIQVGGGSGSGHPCGNPPGFTGIPDPGGNRWGWTNLPGNPRWQPPCGNGGGWSEGPGSLGGWHGQPDPCSNGGSDDQGDWNNGQGNWNNQDGRW